MSVDGGAPLATSSASNPQHIPSRCSCSNCLPPTPGGAMRLGRLTLIVATLVAILLFPILLTNALTALQLQSAYASAELFNAGGRVYQNGNNNGNNNNNNNNSNSNNNNSDDNGNSNGNSNSNGNNNSNDNACFTDLNSNESVPCEDN